MDEVKITKGEVARIFAELFDGNIQECPSEATDADRAKQTADWFWSKAIKDDS